MSKIFGTKIKAVIVAISAITLSLTGLSGAANAQGSSVGLVFISDMTTGGVWVGDISANPQDKELFWSAAGSAIDQVATTDTMVAWSASVSEDSQYQNKLFIAPIAHTAENVVTVDFDASVSALASDQAGERFFAVSDGKIWKINSNGTGKVEVANNEMLYANFWSLAFDPVNRILYSGNDAAWTILKFQLDSNYLNGGSGTEIFNDSVVEGIDGLFVDTVGDRLLWTSYGDQSIHVMDTDGSGHAVLFDSLSLGDAPSGMIWSAATSKMYFTVEQRFVETNIDGTSPRTLYTSGFTGSGFEGFAIAFGVELEPTEDPAPAITSIDPEEGPVAGGTEVTITGTGFQNGAEVKIGGVTCTIVSITPTQIVCTTGAHSAGAVNVKVTNPDEQEDIATGAYTYNAGGGNPEPGSVVKFNKTVYFGGDSSALSSDSKKILNKIASRIPNGATNVKIKVYSYVKKIASDVKGSTLAKSRAKSVVNYLKAKFADATYKSIPNGKGTSTSNTARKAVIKVTYTTPVA